MGNQLFFGDNLDVLRRYIPEESVDLIYLDPPFNSKADYNLIYGTKRGGTSRAQSHAFEDTWSWGLDSKRALDEAAERNMQVGDLLDAFQRIFGRSDMMAYLAMMGVRLIELRRVLKPTGSLYLHCDPTASHYLKILLDTVFGASWFRAEIIWKRTNARGAPKNWPHVHDVILHYSANSNSHAIPKVKADKAKMPHTLITGADGQKYQTYELTGAGITLEGESGRPWRGFDPTAIGRHWGNAHDQLEKWAEAGLIHFPADHGFPRRKDAAPFNPDNRMVTVGDVWTDIDRINQTARERLGYPTQKPLALLERIICASSKAGEVLLDPFCGCGTAVEAAQKLGRVWIGIDVTYLAIHVIETRLANAFGPAIRESYDLLGQPKDADDATALAGRNWLEFQKWVVMRLGGVAKDKPGADGGIDGVIRYHRVGIEQPNRAIVSVKGGMNVGVDAVHKLKSVIEREKAELGILVCIDNPTSAMRKEAESLGEVGPPTRRVPRVQIVPVGRLFEATPVVFPGMVDAPHVGRVAAPAPSKRSKKRVAGQIELLLPITGDAPKPEKKANRAIRTVEVEVVRPQNAGRRKTQS